MRNLARVTDIWAGVCCCHDDCESMTGIIITGSDNVSSNNLKVARKTDITIGGCGHTGVIVTGSDKVIVNNLGGARISDTVVGCNVGVIVTTSNDIFLT